jgi:hypothetical protein
MLVGIARSVVKFVILYIGSDLASSCGRLKFEVARRALEWNAVAGPDEGRIIIVDGQCSAHILHRELEAVFSTVQLIPRLYATAFSCSMAGNFAKMVQHLESIVRKDMETGFHPRMAPPSLAAQAHTKSLAEVCILRIRLVRARHEDGSQVPDDLQALHDEYVALFNGDIRRPCIEHFCHGEHCCEGSSGRAHDKEIAIRRIVQALMQACFALAGCDLPSTTRWYTFSPHMCRQTIGLLTHSVLARVVVAAFDIKDGVGDQ